MEPNKLYNKLLTLKYTKSGDDVDWCVFIEDAVYLAFQQTTSSRDWQVNFNFPVKLYKNQESCIKVARGWGDAYKSCNDEIMQKLLVAHNEHPDLDVVICGWSYGGAMAIIASEDFYFRYKLKPSVITFGAPKPLFGYKTRKYVLSCVKHSEQFSHRSDVVTLLPPVFGYKVLNRVWIGKFNLINLFKPDIYHCVYGSESLYNNL